MMISGLQKVTLLDYPGHIAATIFLGHCNLRCPFCHNMELVVTPEHFPKFEINDIIDFLKGKIGKLNGVAITGGEPLLNNDIRNLLIPIKDLGYPIKLDTNGFFPDMIKELIKEKLVDKFAMDIKAGLVNYAKVSGLNVFDDGMKESIKKSISLLMNDAVDYEFRTTCVKGLHTEEDFYEIKDMINGANNYYLQNYKAAPDMENLPYKPFEKSELLKFADIVRSNVKNIELRGVD